MASSSKIRCHFYVNFGITGGFAGSIILYAKDLQSHNCLLGVGLHGIISLTVFADSGYGDQGGQSMSLKKAVECQHLTTVEGKILSMAPFTHYSTYIPLIYYVSARCLYNNRTKSTWRLLYIAMIGSFLVSLDLDHESRMIARNFVLPFVLMLWFPWSRMFYHNIYGILQQLSWSLCLESFTPSSEHFNIDGFKCVFAVNGFARAPLQKGLPPITLSMEPKVFVHGSVRETRIWSPQAGQVVHNIKWRNCEKK